MKRHGEVRRATESMAVVIPFGITETWERRCAKEISMSGIFFCRVGGGCNALKAGQIGKGSYVHKKCDTGGG